MLSTHLNLSLEFTSIIKHHQDPGRREARELKEALQPLIYLIDSAGSVSQALSGRISGGVEGGLQAPGVTNGNGIAVSQVRQPQTVSWYTYPGLYEQTAGRP